MSVNSKENKNMQQLDFNRSEELQIVTSRNSILLSQLREILINTAWCGGAIAMNALFASLLGAAVGGGIGYGYATWSEPCIDEANSYKVKICALTSPHFSGGALWGAATTALLGAAITAKGLFKSPIKEKAQKLIGTGAFYTFICCTAGRSSD